MGKLWTGSSSSLEASGNTCNHSLDPNYSYATSKCTSKSAYIYIYIYIYRYMHVSTYVNIYVYIYMIYLPSKGFPAMSKPLKGLQPYGLNDVRDPPQMQFRV